MKAGTKLFIVAIGSFLIAARAIKQNSDIKKAAWIIGTWENKTSGGPVYETWNKIKDSEFGGRSYMVKETDTIVFENIRLVQEQNGLFYIPIVKNQNDGLPVRFAATTITETQLVFENPQHDFPQTISYTRIGADTLVAEISGIKSGQQRRQAFPMKRIK
ncbi:MAG: DUF6265 family protein [Agriterribacter sp.]